MKKNRVLILSAIMMMSLVSCGTNEKTDMTSNTSESNSTSQKTSSESKTSSKSSTHKHTYGDWEVVTPATCEQAGSKKKTCSDCGDIVEGTIDALGHQYGDPVVKKAATCAEEGQEELSCTRSGCTHKETRTIAKTDHKWTNEETVTETGMVTYKTSKCSVDNKVKMEWNALDGALASGSSNKTSDNLDGHLKLGSNGNSISYTFKFNRNGTGKIYLFGAMDHWNDSTDNTKRSFFSGKNGSDVVEKETSNFQITVGGSEVVCSNKKTYGEMLTGTSSYSDDGLMEVGDISLSSGENTIVFKRIDSFNPLIKSFVIVFDTLSEEVPDKPFEGGTGAFKNVTQFNDPVDIHTTEQETFLNVATYDNEVNFHIADYASATVHKSDPQPTKISFEHDPKQKSVSYELEYGTQPNLSDKKVVDAKVTSTEKSASIDNLFLAQKYYYRVVAKYTDGTKDEGEIYSFTTKDETLRNIRIDGITNCRDMGNKPVEGGKKMKQGLLYRTAALNSDVAPAGHVTAAGKKYMLDEMGVKSEIELRGGADGTDSEGASKTTSDLGSTVFYKWCGMGYNLGDLGYLKADINKQRIKEAFAVLGDTNNYPNFFHCRIGTDRTGIIAFFVESLCGVSQHDIYQDYLFSNFGKIETSKTRPLKDTLEYYKAVDAYEGGTYSAKAYNYLKEVIKVPTSDLDTIKSVLVG